MTIKTRVTRLEGRSRQGQLPLAVRAWLGHSLSSPEQQQALIEAALPLPPMDWARVSKEGREWFWG